MLARHVAIAALITISIPSTLALAQSEAERSALARELFREGTEHLEAERFEEAAESLGRAYELRPASGIAFNLGAAYEHLGRLVEALEMMRQVSRDDAAPNHLRQLSAEALERIEPRIARLTIRVDGDIGDAVVTLDGREVLEAALDIATPTDPGAHTIQLRRGEEVLETRRVELGDGDTEEVTLHPALSATEIEVAQPEQSTSVGDDTEGGGVASKWWFWTLIGAVVAGGVVAAVLITTSGTEDPIQGTAGVITWP